ncbi:MAG TPA: protoporphyrinogen oxidase [Candidatus Omnitrophota bacterium]|nr:protoporphyrinogen oxidase [Candidatus Omnitrophota bacterium]HPS36934.1 protoporphyrinogen oxidase [Candidatus Omnitrophota bacterium]
MDKNRVVIIGGGISGLCTAYYLRDLAEKNSLPIDITLLERSNRFGGVIRTSSHDTFLTEAGPDAFESDRDVKELCRDLGLAKELVAANPCFRKFFLLKKEKLLPVAVSPGAFLRAPFLSLPSKFRMLLEPFVPAGAGDPNESLGSFITRRLGAGFLKEFIDPLARGIYMTAAGELSLEANFPGLRESERICGSLRNAFRAGQGLRKSPDADGFFTLKGGLEVLTRALVHALEVCELRPGAPVDHCDYDGEWKIFLENGESLRADSVCLAMTTFDAAKLLPICAPGLSQELLSVRYDSIAAVSLVFRAEDVPASPMDFGFIVPAVMGDRPFSSLKWLGKTPTGTHIILKIFLSEAMLPEFFCENNEMLLQRILTTLAELFGIRALPQTMTVERYPEALPQYAPGHGNRIRAITERLVDHPGLYLTGNAFHGFGITDCIREARKTAEAIFAQSRSFLPAL